MLLIKTYSYEFNPILHSAHAARMVEQINQLITIGSVSFFLCLLVFDKDISLEGQMLKKGKSINPISHSRTAKFLHYTMFL